jgi:hypothetical protein
MSKREVDYVSTDDKLQRVIASDQRLIALKQLRDLETSQDLRAEIHKMVQARVAEINQEYSRTYK